MSPLADRGRRIVIVVLWLQLMLAAAVILMWVAFGRFDRAGRRLLMLLAEVGVMRGLWKGSRWAKWLYTIGFFAAAALMIAFSLHGPNRLSPAAAGTVAAAFAGVGYLLGFSGSVAAFMAHQRLTYEFGELERSLVAASAERSDASMLDVGEFDGRCCDGCGKPVPVQIDWCPACGAECQPADV